MWRLPDRLNKNGGPTRKQLQLGRADHKNCRILQHTCVWLFTQQALEMCILFVCKVLYGTLTSTANSIPSEQFNSRKFAIATV